jgi:hypothetical protein
MRKYLLIGGLVLAAFAAKAQINVVPQVGLITSVLRVPTYSATSVGLAPASSATDIYCISAGTTKNVSIRQIKIGGTAGTAITTPFLIYRRSALGTSGTAATGIALPVPVPLNTSDPASTATLTAYTANPTVAANPILMDAATVDLPVTTAAGGAVEAVMTYGTGVDLFNRGLDILKNTTQQICVNLNGVSVSSGVLDIGMIWQEQ